MSSGLALITNGVFTNVSTPRTAQDLASFWTHPIFPGGVQLHKMVHLKDQVKTQISVHTPKTLSLCLLCTPTRFISRDARECNYHEIPRPLDTELFFGNLLMILTIDGTDIVPLTQQQYVTILNADITEELGRYGVREKSYSASPREVIHRLDSRGSSYNGVDDEGSYDMSISE